MRGGEEEGRIWGDGCGLCWSQGRGRRTRRGATPAVPRAGCAPEITPWGAGGVGRRGSAIGEPREGPVQSWALVSKTSAACTEARH